VQTVFSIIGLLGGLAGIAGAFYTYTQVKLIREDRARRERAELELTGWSARAQDAAQKLAVLFPRISKDSGRPLYHVVIPDAALRGQVENYLIHLIDGRAKAEARMLTPDMLKLPVVQNAIKRVEDCFDVVRKGNPAIATLASLG
jgi:hypothetical protein